VSVARRVLVPALDGLIAVLLLAVIAIALTGGGIFTVQDIRIRARSIDNLLLALAAFAALRAVAARSLPFLGIRGTAPGDLAGRARGWIVRVEDRMATLTPRAAWIIVAALAAATLAIKLATAWSHPGFFSGDDVEVQEMSLARVFGQTWPIWDLRSPFFPLGVIYPAQALAAAAGVTDPAALVAIGRSVVAVLSTATVPLVFVALRRAASAPTAILGAALVSLNFLLVTFGSTELPRPVAASLIVAAYVFLQLRTRSGATAAAVAIALAALLRFSEVVFLAPACLQLIIERRTRDMWHLAWVATASIVTIQAVVDWLFWNEAFYSLTHAIRYTLVEGQSTRGFQPPWYYLTSIGAWTDPVMLSLAAYGAWRRAWQPALWLLVPLVALSLLPHKEPRYLVPLAPFVSMLAAVGGWAILTRLARAAPETTRISWRPLIFVAALAASALVSVNRFHVRRSDDAVAHARDVAASRQVRGVAVEQLWRWGGRLYLGRVPALVELDGRLPDATALRREAAAESIEWIGLRDDTCQRLDCAQVMHDAGFVEHDAADESTDRAFRRVR
jgi:hypothetical protein